MPPRPLLRALGASLLLVGPSSSQCELETLTAPDAVGGEKFGLDVDQYGPYAIFGAPYDAEAGSLAGAAHVFELQDGAWIEVTKFVASDAEELDRTGWRVALDGETAVVGSRYTEDFGYGTGTVYVLERQTDGTWVETDLLLADDAESFAFFGHDLDLAADVIAVGAPSDDDLGPVAGAVYVFERSGGAFSQTAKLYGGTTAANDRVGYSVAVDGSVLVAGSFQHDNGTGTNSGVAYVFERQAGAWVETAELVPSDAAESQAFGIDVDVWGSRIVVGAHLDDTVAPQAGAVYVFEHQGGSWVETQKLTAADGASTDYFGESVAIARSGILIGAFDADAVGPKSGAAYLAPFDGVSFGAPTRFLPDDLGPADAFGVAVSIGDESLFVSSRNSDAGFDNGSVYSFSVTDRLLFDSTTDTISLSGGGSQTLELETCPPRPDHVYFVLGSVSGTEPGFDVGHLHLPLNPDFYFLLSLSDPNAYPLATSVGLLDAEGRATGLFGLAAGENPNLAGTVVHHAYGLVDPLGAVVPLASAPLAVTLVP